MEGINRSSEMSPKSYKATIAFIYSFQFILVILFAIFCKYDERLDAVRKDNSGEDEMFKNTYPLFQDVHVMIFVGFGFLMTFLQRYGFSAVGFTFLISAMMEQWGILCYGFLRSNATDGKYSINIMSLMMGEVIAAVILISFGAVLGKTSPIQLLLMGTIETVLFTANEYLGSEILKVADAGGSIFVHSFGAYFGLAVSLTLRRKEIATMTANKLESSSYQSDVTSLIGTVFLWLFWPSFNAGVLDGNERHRAIINTYLSLASCCAAAFATSSLITDMHKFNMVHIQNATLAGGVCIGTVANMMVQPYGALLIGSFAGVLTTFGYEYLQGWLMKKIKLHDTCGVHNLHGIPGVAAGVISAFMACLASEANYGQSLYKVFPAMEGSMGRSGSLQAGYQILALTITLGTAIVGGLITGVAIRNAGKVIEHYDDEVFWCVPESATNGNEVKLNRKCAKNDGPTSIRGKA